jgi:hypothetical protein
VTSDRHGVRGAWRAAWGSGRTGRGVGLGVSVLAVLVCGGCFGDWVSARPRPERGGEVEAAAEPPAAAEACAAYVAAVAERCDAVLDGDMGRSRCHPEIVRVMAVFHEGDEPLDHRPRPVGSRAQTCAQYLRALPEPSPRRAGGPELGPQCRAWAQAVRERCVAPLSTLPPDLRGCGSELPAFESTLGAITFGRPQDYEPLCRDAVAQLLAAPG